MNGMVHVDNGRSGGLCAFHLFAGAGGGILADSLLGCDIVGAVELEKYPREVLLSRQADGLLPRFPVWDDVCTFRSDNEECSEYIERLRSIRDRLVIAGGFPCFEGGTLVLTEGGYKPIEEVCIGDAVLTHRGNWKRVTAVMFKEGAEIWKVKGFGVPELHTTAEHPFYVSDGRGTEVRFTAAESLRAGESYLSMVDPPAEDADDHSAEWWWLAGRYLADGWRVDRKGRKNGRVVICANREKAPELEEGIRAAGFNFTRVSERTADKFHITRGDFYADLAEFGRGAEGKHLTRRAYGLPRPKLQALFDGYMSGDGRCDKIEATSVSKRLVLDMCIVARRLGYPVPAFYHSRRDPHHTIEGRVCNQKDTYTFKVNGANGSSAYREGEYTFGRVRYTEKAGYTARVYNLSVKDDESYIVENCIVHNCQDISVAGKGAGLEGARSGLWAEMWRIIGEVGPRFVFVENSSMLLVRGGTRVVGDLTELGYDCRWGVISAASVGANHRRDRFWLWGKNTAYPDSDLYGCNGDGRGGAEISE